MLPRKKYSVKTIVEILRRRVWLLVLPPVVALFAALVFSASLPNLYQSDVLVAIVRQRVPDEFVRSTVTLRTEDRLGPLETQVTSRTTLERLIQELDLYRDDRQRLPMEDLVLRMRRAIVVVPEAPRRGPHGPEPLHAFHVRFSYPDPVVAARVAQRLGSTFVDQNALERDGLAKATNEFLESQLAETRERLEAHESRLEAFRQQHGNELPTQFQSNMQAIQSTQMQIQALVESAARDRDRRLMLERIYNEVQSEPAMVLPQAAQVQGANPTGPSSGSARQQLVSARQNLAQLELRYKPDHPDIARSRRMVAELEVKASAEKTAEPESESTVPASQEEVQRRTKLREMRAEMESLVRQLQFKESEERRLRAIVAEYQRRIEAVPGLEAEWAALTRDYDTQQTAYKAMLAKSEQSKVALDLERRQIGEQFRILDPAGVPTKPISPIRLQINGIGLGIGLLLGIGLAALLEFKDQTYRTENDVLDALKLPVLALIPYVVIASERRDLIRRRLVIAASSTAAVAVAGYFFWSMKLWNYLA